MLTFSPQTYNSKVNEGRCERCKSASAALGCLYN